MKKIDRIDREEAFRRLSEATPTPKTELIYKNAYNLSVAVTLSAIKTINFYPSKGKHIIAAAQMLVNHFRYPNGSGKTPRCWPSNS